MAEVKILSELVSLAFLGALMWLSGLPSHFLLFLRCGVPPGSFRIYQQRYGPSHTLSCVPCSLEPFEGSFLIFCELKGWERGVSTFLSFSNTLSLWIDLFLTVMEVLS